jgi:hypothetical protein
VSIEREWHRIREVVARGQRSIVHCAIGSIGQDGMPNVTPVGTVFLRDDLSGYYFDQYASGLGRNIDANPRVCVMAVDGGRLFWMRSLFTGRFALPPGVRLYGTAGPRRAASDEELRLIQERTRPTQWLRGSRLLWSDFTHVRDIAFTGFRPVLYPKMMDGMWDV